jgi:hypothetical protein
MSAESTSLDPYEAVLADLKAKRAQIDNMISVIEAFRSGQAILGNPVTGALSVAPPDSPSEGPGAFLGMTIPDAARKLLAIRKQAMRNPDIAEALQAGGLHMNSAEPANTIGSVLTRRFNEVGDIVKVGRGTWGLKEWYPNRSFKKDKPNGDESKAEAAS